jgi:hypothetical protein
LDTKFTALPQPDSAIVYIRPVQVSDLPADLQDEIGALATVYAVHRPDGERVALVADRKLAFYLAREHEMTPVSVH